MINLIIADNNELVRIGLRSVFKGTDVQIVSEARDAQELISQVGTFQPDVVLIDYTSDEFSIDVVPKIMELASKMNVVAITPTQSATTVINAVKAGIISHVKKNCSIEEIKDAVVQTASGNRFFCGNIIKTIQKEGIDVKGLGEMELSCEPIVLSEREIEIITMIAEGWTNKQISEKLFLSNHTINTHRKNIMGKLGVKNTAGIVMYAVKENHISPNKFLFN
ncbi:MAG: response regulator transcription factor [Crocinitomicaceae bacterium]|nr:response regulator transcription factor [Crocinitomicaceae bacterium]